MPEPVICPICNRSCAAATGLASHMRSMHPKEYHERVDGARAAQPSVTRPDVPPPSPSNGIRWEDPPTSRPGRNGTLLAVQAAVPELKRNAGRWARLVDFKGPTSAGAAATALRKQLPDLEIIGRKVGAGSAVFARYVEEQ